MTYNPNWPNPAQPPPDQTSQIRTNWAQFEAIFNSNHTSLNDQKQGDHEAIVFQTQTQDPDVTQNQASVYSKDTATTASTEPQIYYRIPVYLPNQLNSAAPGNPPTQLTYQQVNRAGPQYQSFLPGGYLIYWGSASSVNTNIVLSPSPSRILAAIANANNRTTSGIPTPFDAQVQIISANTFRIRSSTATGVFTFSWMVIAKQ